MSGTAALRPPQYASRRVLELSRLLRRYPELGVLILAAAAWVTLVVFEATGSGALSHHHGQSHLMYMHGAAHPMLMGAPSDSPVSALFGALPVWIVMSAAMMLPTCVPAIRHVAHNSLRRRQQRAVSIFALTYLMLWTIFGVMALGVAWMCFSAFGAGTQSAAVLLAVALAAAGLWQLTPHKQRFLRACHRTVALPPRGWLADAACARFGARYATSCVASCCFLMGAMAFVHHDHLVWTAILTAIIALETYRNVTRRDLRCIGSLLIVGAIVVVIP